MSELSNNDFDSLFEESEVKPAQNTQQAFDKEKWIEEKAIEREQAYTTIEEMTETVSDNQEDFGKYLLIASRFPKLTVQNQLLILSQNPSATDIKAYDDWENMGIGVNKGEKGIIQIVKSGEYEKADGTMGINYATKKVFDVSQTDVEPIKNDIANLEVRLKALIKSSYNPVVGTKEMKENENCFYDSDERCIYIYNTGHIGEMYENLSREMALAYFDHHSDEYERSDYLDKAECVSYIISQRNGFERNAPELDSLDLFSNCDSVYDVRGVLTDINRCANSISYALEKDGQSKNNQTREAR